MLSVVFFGFFVFFLFASVLFFALLFVCLLFRFVLCKFFAKFSLSVLLRRFIFLGACYCVLQLRPIIF